MNNDYKIFDPRTGRYKLSANPALIFLDLLAREKRVLPKELLEALPTLKPWVKRMADFCDSQPDCPTGMVLD
jgi:hypothetical protein